MEPDTFEGVAGRTLAESTAWWPPIPSAPEGAPNIVMVLLDDVGYAQFGCYGSDIATPTFDRLAAGGLRYSNFHTTALCSPTRACLLTGRNHHASGMGRIVEFSSGFPGYDATMPKANGFLSEILGAATATRTFAVGKWHLAPANEMATGASHATLAARARLRALLRLPRRRDRPVPPRSRARQPPDRSAPHARGGLPPHRGSRRPGHRLPEGPARHVARRSRSSSTSRPAPATRRTRCRSSTAIAYKGKFDHGWDALARRGVRAAAWRPGCCPRARELSERPHWIPAWDSLTRRRAPPLRPDDGGLRRLPRAHRRAGRSGRRLHREPRRARQHDRVGHERQRRERRGRSARARSTRTYFFNCVPESLEENLRRIDDLGGPDAHNHYPWGWAWAGNTPLKRWKRETHEGGVTDPLIVCWPDGIGRPGETRQQYVHAIDVMPTLLDVDRHRRARRRSPASSSVRSTARASRRRSPTSTRRAPRDTQYYEMLGCRAHLPRRLEGGHVPSDDAASATTAATRASPFDEDEWELYHVAEDFSETHDLAEKEPDRLARARSTCGGPRPNATRCFPLTNQPGRHGDRRFRRQRYEYHAGIGVAPPDAGTRTCATAATA